MKPKENMSPQERKEYIEYVLNNDLTHEENEAYIEYLEKAELEFGCDASIVPIEVLREGKGDEFYKNIKAERSKGKGHVLCTDWE